MKHVISLAVIVIALGGCTKKASVPEQVLCSFEGVVTTLLTTEIVNKLQCANPAAVTASLQKGLRQMDLCKMHDERKKKKKSEGVVALGAVGDVVCAPAISALHLGLLMSIPPEWGCTGPVDAEALKASLLEKCLTAI
jgi:hypothetical protein